MFLLLFIATLAIGFGTQWYVKSQIRRFHQIPGSSGLTGAEVAARILHLRGIRDVHIQEQDGFLGDHYDPRHKKLVLSSEIFHGTSISALAVAAHEAGHAMQHQQAYFPLHLRMAAVSLTNVASQVVMWLPLVGMFTQIISPLTGLAVMAAAWGVIMAFNLVTLPVEFDASRRAKQILTQLGVTSGLDQQAAVAKVLNAAALTYVGAFVSSLLYFLYYLSPFLGSRDED